MSFAVHTLCPIRYIPYFPYVMAAMQMARLANAEFLRRKQGNEHCFCKMWFYDRFLFLLVLIHIGNNISYIQSMRWNHYNQPSKEQNLPPAQQISSAASQTNQNKGCWYSRCHVCMCLPNPSQRLTAASCLKGEEHHSKKVEKERKEIWCLFQRIFIWIFLKQLTGLSAARGKLGRKAAGQDKMRCLTLLSICQILIITWACWNRRLPLCLKISFLSPDVFINGKLL